MTVASSNYRNTGNGDGSTTCFSYTFRTLENTHLKVYVAGTLKTLTTDYTVTGVGEASGGKVVFGTPPTLNQLVVIERDVPLTQTTAYVEGSRFPATSHETALDKLTMIVQTVKGIALRSWRFAAGSSYAGAGYEVDEPRGGYYPRVKSDCTGIEFVALENCGTYANPVTSKGDLIRGDDAGAQSRLGIGSAGLVLTVDPGGKPEWRAGGTILLRNKTDDQADAGRIFTLSLDCDSAFVAHVPNANTGMTACGRFAVVTPAFIGDDCQGQVLLGGGPVTMLASGNIARGDYVKWGTTFGSVATTCVGHTHHRPAPKGAVGVAAGHSAAGCVAVIKFDRPASGQQGLSVVRGNRSASVAASHCTQVTLVATALVLADSCNDVVVVRNPANLTNNISTDLTNKKNSRDQAGAFSAGDVHFYWVYEGDCGQTYSRSSAKGPDTSGPELPVCETHWAYSHSLYWNTDCLKRHTVRGSRVTFDCLDANRVLIGTAATACETRVNLTTFVPAIAQTITLQATLDTLAGTNIDGCVHLGVRLSCVGWILAGSGTAGERTTIVLDVPNVNQEVYYRMPTTSALPKLSLAVIGFTVPNGE